MITIRTPKGKRLSLAQYEALVDRNQQPCEHGHLGCAAWENGPCIDELLCRQEDEQQGGEAA